MRALLDRLASWGFIVISTQDDDAKSGKSCIQCAKYMVRENKNKDSIFYKKVDTKNIGITGQSEGGVAVLNAVTKYKSSKLFKAVCSMSNDVLGSTTMQATYNPTKIKIPTLLMAGVNGIDHGCVIESTYALINNGELTISARRKNTVHSTCCRNCDAYMTAWFLYMLKGDQTAAKVFVGKNAEILSNDNYMLVQRKN